jgi:enoyl-CoA hydratase/carnithine racemase
MLASEGDCVTSPVRYELDGVVGTIVLDDGKANALSPTMQHHINTALDTAEQDASKAVVVAGNQKLFCGGFDLSVFATGDTNTTLDMLTGGFTLAVRLLTFGKPIVVAATGPAIAMGAFLLLCGDHRVGSSRTRCQANEVAIGMPLPVAAIEIMRMRLTPAAFQRGIALAAPFSDGEAVTAGWLDEIVDPAAVLVRARAVAGDAATLNSRAHVSSKRKARHCGVTAILGALELLPAELEEILATMAR